jgi:hypothetical protein
MRHNRQKLPSPGRGGLGWMRFRLIKITRLSLILAFFDHRFRVGYCRKSRKQKLGKQKGVKITPSSRRRWTDFSFPHFSFQLFPSCPAAIRAISAFAFFRALP